MAQKVTVQLVDDLDGGTANETVTFGLDGNAYDIDLSTANAAALRQALARYIAAGRRSRSAVPRRTRLRATGDSRSALIRAWAREQGIPVNERGRISADVARRYDAAH